MRGFRWNQFQELVGLYMKNKKFVEAGKFGELMADIWITLFTNIYV